MHWKKSGKYFNGIECLSAIYYLPAAHSFKFAAQLQAKQKGPDPVLIRIETKAGHGAGTPVSKTIEQYADIFGFTLWNMGIKKLK